MFSGELTTVTVATSTTAPSHTDRFYAGCRRVCSGGPAATRAAVGAAAFTGTRYGPGRRNRRFMRGRGQCPGEPH
eukprot:745764-Hanusia_phi.AAC.5